MIFGNSLKGLIRLIGYLVPLSAVLLLIWAYINIVDNPSSKNSEVDAPIVKISTQVPGKIINVAVLNNTSVKQGELLFEIDPISYELELERAKASLATATAEFRQGQRNLEFEKSVAEVAKSQIDGAKTKLELAHSNFMRLSSLLKKGFTTEQDVQTARTTYLDEKTTYEQALSHAQGTKDVIGTLDKLQAQIKVAKATVKLAEHNLKHTKVFAPISGNITGMKLTVGEYLTTGSTLFSLIDTTNWKVSALFKETDLPRIKLGSKAQVFLLSAENQIIDGYVLDIGWGIRSDDSREVDGLPSIVNKLDWIVVAKRFPIEIKLINPPPNLTRLGASAYVRILDEMYEPPSKVK